MLTSLPLLFLPACHLFFFFFPQGEKQDRIVTLIGDTTAKLSKDIDGTKDEITIQGNSLDAVSQSCANIQQIAKVKDKDIRKFLDGVYVSYRGSVVEA